MPDRASEPPSTASQQLVYPTPPEHVRQGGLRSAIRLFGPGAIIASVTIGSGETLFASRTGAIFGYTMLWFVLVCVICKLVQVYIAGRYMVLTGEHPMEAWARLPGPRGWFPALIGTLSFACFPFWLGALAMMLGTAMNWILGLDQAPIERQRLFIQCFGTVTLILAAGFTLVQTYTVFEKVQTAIVAILLLAILAALAVAPAEWIEVLRRFVLVQIPDYPDWMHEKYATIVDKESVLLSLVIFMTAIGGGTYDYIGYLSFFREKRWGGLIANTGSNHTSFAPIINQTEANLSVGRQWLRAPLIDVFAGFLCVLIFTVAFNILGAAILHPKQLVPDEFALLTPQAEFLTQFGAGFKYLYQIGILMAFWGTIYGAFEIYCRTGYECVRPLVSRLRHLPYKRFRLPVCLYSGIGGIILIWTAADPMVIVRPVALIGAVTCGLWCYAMIWADRKILPAPLRMNTAWLVLNLLAGTVLFGFGAKAILDYCRSF